MKEWQKILVGILGGLLGAGLILLLVSQPRGQPVILRPAPSPAPLLVHVSGAVNQPGVYALPAGSRVQDAIQAAGGLAPAAQAAALNLAALVQDGGKVVVPAAPPTADPARVKTSPAATLAPVSAAPAFPININTASLEELDRLPGIGPAIAQRIIDYRTRNGPFVAIEDIQKVAGIGPKIFDDIKDLITVDQ